MTHTRRWTAATAAVALAAGLAACGEAEKTSPKAGDDVLTNTASYGWATSKDVGALFTTGLTVSEVAQGPIIIEDVDPVLEGDVLDLDGQGVRVLNESQQGQGFQELPEWPPKAKSRQEWDLFGGLQGDGNYEVPAPVNGKPAVLHVLLGYKVLKKGRGVQRGVWVTYRHNGAQKKAFLGSYLAVCAPASEKCSKEGPKGEEK
ncbi:hypothetical protein GCM10010124_10350 [Pilimelia terevasa]|uniref:Lipoprotein n=1 Tax=Pilimelia terevasa TaxID=53372 RepID=A0A8J3BLH8_9ACTN|nr:hypothetical protein [Pilimelia terevasa]GGK19672.1 hypothetical protein GCM10010124_10350 [Pilimelia terevasa]